MQTKTLAIAGGAVVVVAIAAAMILRPAEEDVAQGSAPEVPVEVATAPDVQAGDDAAGAPEATDGTTGGATALRITEFRFEPDGGYVVMGTAPPEMDIAVLLDEIEVERMPVAPDGTFLAVGFLGFSDVPRVFSVIGDPDGAALAADRRYVLDANPAPDTGSDTAPDTAPAQVAQTGAADMPEGEDTEAQAATPEGAQPSAGPAILALTEDGVEVVQPAIAADSPPDVMSSVALDTITYDPAGDVVLGGRATGEGFVQVYVDNAPISRLPIDVDGNWRGDLPDVDTGVYTLRIDEVDSGGDVVSRIETPFLREDRDAVADVMADQVDDPTFTIATRTVQPGATLWAIAQEQYGAGVLYVNVFEANKDRIRDPDLIYPGQVFVLPDENP